MHPPRTSRSTRLRSWRPAALALLAVAALALSGCAAAAAPSPTPTPSTTGPVSVAHDIVFAQPGGVPLRLDACTPGGSRGPLPAVVIVHSGAFTEGSHSDLDWLCKQGAEHGFATFTVDYRLLPAAHFPGQLQDVVAAVDWISADAQAKRFSVDPKRIALLGTSAGATIIAELLTGVPGSPVPPSRFVGGAMLSAAYDFTVLPKEGLDTAGAQVTLGYAGCASFDCPALATVSAIRSVDRTDPPMFLANSTNELVPVQQATEMDAALTGAGVRHELHIVDGKDHAEFIAMNHPDVDAAMWRFLTSITR